MRLHPLERGHSPTQLEFQAGRTGNAAQRRDTLGWRGRIQGVHPRKGTKRGMETMERPWWRVLSVSTGGKHLHEYWCFTCFQGECRTQGSALRHGETENQDFFSRGESGKCFVA